MYVHVYLEMGILFHACPHVYYSLWAGRLLAWCMEGLLFREFYLERLLILCMLRLLA